MESTLGYLKLKDVLALFPVSRSTWYQGMLDGVYPKPVKLTGRRAVAWRRSDIYALISSGETL